MIIEGSSARKICGYLNIEPDAEAQVSFTECDAMPGLVQNGRGHLLSITRANPGEGNEVYYFQESNGPATIILKHDEGNTVITLDGKADVEMVTKLWKRQADGALKRGKTILWHPTSPEKLKIIDGWHDRTEKALLEARQYTEGRQNSTNLYALLGLT
jgi:hypothetical protein